MTKSDQNTTQTPAPMSVLGVRIDPMTIEEVVEEAVTWIKSEQRSWHLCSGVNLHQLMLMDGDPRMNEVVSRSDRVLPDGASIVFAGALLHRRFMRRSAAIDVMWKLLDVASAQNHSVFLLGATKSVLQRAKASLEGKWPGVRIVGALDGYFPENATVEILKQIDAARPDILLVAISSPKREHFFYDAQNYLDVPFVIGVGGAFDILAGLTTRAPLAVQIIGAEFLWRAAQEPRRMIPRYYKNFRFAVSLLKNKAPYR